MSGSENSQPSTLKSYTGSGIAAVQSVVGSLTGNPVDQRQVEDRKAHAELEHNASHVAAKAGPFNLSSSGAVAVDNKNRRDGKADQIIGSGKEFVGNTIGSDSLKRCRAASRLYFGSCRQSYRNHWSRYVWSDWQYPGTMLLTLRSNMIRERLPSAASRRRCRNNRKTSTARDGPIYNGVHELFVLLRLDYFSFLPPFYYTNYCVLL
ncbi:hypothetical protein B9Z19DRAFT_1048395 [Tuber borchii]|uniref:Uncharacterized protein n=1 Tax=Tuber borchii TaxID=42251 RepID=A0A2T6ZSJ7_TUBBO|nr:hypothetical protein B9Z19DRAFT_1048395 [Tuber borchii]